MLTVSMSTGVPRRMGRDPERLLAHSTIVFVTTALSVSGGLALFTRGEVAPALWVLSDVDDGPESARRRLRVFGPGRIDPAPGDGVVGNIRSPPGPKNHFWFGSATRSTTVIVRDQRLELEKMTLPTPG